MAFRSTPKTNADVDCFKPIALHFILLFGGELFTGNTMILSVGMYDTIYVAAQGY